RLCTWSALDSSILVPGRTSAPTGSTASEETRETASGGTHRNKQPPWLCGAGYTTRRASESRATRVRRSALPGWPGSPALAEGPNLDQEGPGGSLLGGGVPHL